MIAANGTRVEDQYKSLSEFEVILQDACMSASTDFEEEFAAQVKENFAQFKGRMYWSEKQDLLLRKIAGPEDY